LRNVHGCLDGISELSAHQIDDLKETLTRRIIYLPTKCTFLISKNIQ